MPVEPWLSLLAKKIRARYEDAPTNAGTHLRQTNVRTPKDRTQVFCKCSKPTRFVVVPIIRSPERKANVDNVFGMIQS